MFASSEHQLLDIEQRLESQIKVYRRISGSPVYSIREWAYAERGQLEVLLEEVQARLSDPLAVAYRKMGDWQKRYGRSAA